MGRPPGRGYLEPHDHDRWHPAQGLATAPQRVPARARAPGRGVRAARQLHRDGPVSTDQRHDPAPVRPARRTPARTEPAPPRRWLRAGAPRAPPRGPADGAGQRGDRVDPDRRTCRSRPSWSTPAGTWSSANDAVYRILDGVAPQLLEPPVNVIRLTLDPGGLAPRIVNLAEWRAHLIASAPARVRRERRPAPRGAAGGSGLRRSTTGTAENGRRASHTGSRRTLRLRAGDVVLSFLSTTTVFGTPREVTLSELAIEAFYPADQGTRDLLVR